MPSQPNPASTEVKRKPQTHEPSSILPGPRTPSHNEPPPKNDFNQSCHNLAYPGFASLISLFRVTDIVCLTPTPKQTVRPLLARTVQKRNAQARAREGQCESALKTTPKTESHRTQQLARGNMHELTRLEGSEGRKKASEPSENGKGIVGQGPLTGRAGPVVESIGSELGILGVPMVGALRLFWGCSRRGRESFLVCFCLCQLWDSQRNVQG